MINPTHNPYALELTLARVFGWLGFVVLVIWVLAWITSTAPKPLLDNAGLVTLVLVVCWFWIGATEHRAESGYEKYENTRLQMLLDAGRNPHDNID